MKNSQFLWPLILVGATIVGCSQANRPVSMRTPTPVVTVTATSAPQHFPLTNSLSSRHSATPGRSTPRATSPLQIEETGVSRALDCAGQDVMVGGSENRITLRGRVGRLVVSGSTNQITVENATTVELTGVENLVSWKGTEPRVDNPGNENRVQGPTQAPGRVGEAVVPTPIPMH